MRVDSNAKKVATLRNCLLFYTNMPLFYGVISHIYGENLMIIFNLFIFGATKASVCHSTILSHHKTFFCKQVMIQEQRKQLFYIITPISIRILHRSMNLKSSCGTLCKFVDMNKSPNEALMYPIYFNPFPTIPTQFILLHVVYKQILLIFLCLMSLSNYMQVKSKRSSY